MRTYRYTSWNQKIDSGRVVDLIICKNCYVLIKEIHKILGKHDSKKVFRSCLSSLQIRKSSLNIINDVNNKIYGDLEHQMNLIYFGKNIFNRIQKVLKILQT